MKILETLLSVVEAKTSSDDSDLAKKVKAALVGKTVKAFGGKPGLYAKHDGPVKFVITNTRTITYDHDSLAHFASLNVYLALEAKNHIYRLDFIGDLYTDEGLENEIRKLLKPIKLITKISYSESGMQGKDFVNFDLRLVD